MAVEHSDQKSTRLREKIANLENYISNLSDIPDEAHREELLVTLEELHVAEEELRQQNEDLRQVQKMLDQEREKYLKLFALSPDGHVLTDTNGIILEANLAFWKLLNASPDLMLKQSLRDLIVEGQQLHFEIMLIQPEQFSNREIHLQPRTGAPIPTELSLMPINGEHFEIAHLFWNFHDMRVAQLAAKTQIENMRLQEQIEAQRFHAQLDAEKAVSSLKSEIMVIINHGFRTPLTIIQAAASNLENYLDRLSEQRRGEKFQTIYDQIKRLTAMMDNIGLVVQGVSNIQKVNRSNINIGDYCENLIRDIRALEPDLHTITLEIYDRAALAFVDKYLLDLILRPIIHNAVLYSLPEGAVKLVVSRNETDLVFQVVDQGIGIPFFDQGFTFKSIHRGSNVGHRNGLGLSLKIAHECVNLYGGRISFQSKESKGSTFTVSLPVFSLDTP